MRNSLFFLVITLLPFISCKKESSSANPDPSSAKVKTYTEDYTSGAFHVSYTFNLNYDSKDRLISMVSSSTTGDRIEWSYSSSTVAQDLYNSNALSIHQIFYLNSILYPIALSNTTTHRIQAAKSISTIAVSS